MHLHLRRNLPLYELALCNVACGVARRCTPARCHHLAHFGMSLSQGGGELQLASYARSALPWSQHHCGMGSRVYAALVVDDDVHAAYNSSDIHVQYDHLEFSGVVPRTFIGPIALAALASPSRLIFSVADSRFVVMLCGMPCCFSIIPCKSITLIFCVCSHGIVRIVLGALFVASFSFLRRRYAAHTGLPDVATWAVLVYSLFPLCTHCALARPLRNAR